MPGPFDFFGVVHNDGKDYYLTEEPVEIDCGVYEAEAVDAFGNKVNVELEGWGDGDFDLDTPLDVW